MIDRRYKSEHNQAPATPSIMLLLAGLLFILSPTAGLAQSTDQSGKEASARSGGVFEVRGVNVDVTAVSTKVARDKALALGESMAFRYLLERLTMRADQPRLPELSTAEIVTYVLDFEVAKEKASTVRYLATLNYRFKADKVRDLLIERGIPFAETASKPVLVLPVYKAAGALSLWDDPNPWRDAWAARKPGYSLVPTILPLGDLTDIAAIGPEQAVLGDEQRFAVLSARYHTGDTMVAHATVVLGRGRPELDVYVTRYSTDQQQQTVVKNFVSNDGETLDQLLNRAADELTAQIEDNWKRDNLLQFGDRAVIAVTIKIGSLEDWLNVRKRLSDVAVIRRSDLIILSLDEARVNLNYIGSLEQLSLALEQADLKLHREGDGWILEYMSGGGKS